MNDDANNFYLIIYKLCNYINVVDQSSVPCTYFEIVLTDRNVEESIFDICNCTCRNHNNYPVLFGAHCPL